MDLLNVLLPADTDADMTSAGLEANYSLGRELGAGGSGIVRLVTKLDTGVQYACKSIKKQLADPAATPEAQAKHQAKVRREVDVLRLLRGTAGVVQLEEVYEDDIHFYLVMEYGSGGELQHPAGHRHYDECTVSSYMQAVLNTLAQCHKHHILHRDVKPGNFVLLNAADSAPLKALDFGLAVIFDPQALPLTNLGTEGTPWFMAPEALSSAVVPQSDVWSAGVMAYQMLTGHFPFDDWKHRSAPALSLVWRSILTEEPQFKSSYWKDISPQAQDFVKSLLIKDPKKRPQAEAALAHPWLNGCDIHRRAWLNAAATPLPQALAQGGAVRRTVPAAVYRGGGAALAGAKASFQGAQRAGMRAVSLRF